MDAGAKQRVQRVGWVEPSLAKPITFRKLELMGIASAFALPPSLFELRSTGRASADKSLHPSYKLP
jgi:hypothetical protein